MKQIRQYTNAALHHIGLCVSAATILACIASGVVLAATTPTTCKPGTYTTSAGQCCPAEQTQFTNTGDVNCSNTPGACDNVTNANAMQCLLTKYVNPAIGLLSAAVAVVVVITIIRGAITYTSSAGDPSKAAAGKQHITNALIGLAAWLMLYAFLQFIIPGGLLN